MNNDNQYNDDTVGVVSEVEHSSGWSVQMGNGWSVWVTNENCKTAPVAGEVIRLYGKGIGYTVRGIVIGGRVYRYATPEQSDADEAEMLNRLKREREERDTRFRAELPNLPALPKFEIIDADAWEKSVSANTDPYGYACIKYAATWANIMDSRIADGAKVADIAEQTSHEADTDGITGFMFGCALSVLSQCWKHGGDLRQWREAGRA